MSRGRGGSLRMPARAKPVHRNGAYPRGHREATVIQAVRVATKLLCRQNVSGGKPAEPCSLSSCPCGCSAPPRAPVSALAALSWTRPDSSPGRPYCGLCGAATTDPGRTRSPWQRPTHAPRRPVVQCRRRAAAPHAAAARGTSHRLAPAGLCSMWRGLRPTHRSLQPAAVAPLDRAHFAHEQCESHHERARGEWSAVVSGTTSPAYAGTRHRRAVSRCGREILLVAAEQRRLQARSSGPLATLDSRAISFPIAARSPTPKCTRLEITRVSPGAVAQCLRCFMVWVGWLPADPTSTTRSQAEAGRSVRPQRPRTEHATLLIIRQCSPRAEVRHPVEERFPEARRMTAQGQVIVVMRR